MKLAPVFIVSLISLSAVAGQAFSGNQYEPVRTDFQTQNILSLREKLASISEKSGLRISSSLDHMGAEDLLIRDGMHAVFYRCPLRGMITPYLLISDITVTNRNAMNSFIIQAQLDRESITLRLEESLAGKEITTPAEYTFAVGDDGQLIQVTPENALELEATVRARFGIPVTSEFLESLPDHYNMVCGLS